MKVNEIFLSIQGESVYTGLPTVFVRFSGCNLRCSYCDTEYAYEDGVEIEPEGIFQEIRKHFYKRVCITGGEPLLQRDLEKLLVLLKDYNVTIETNGSMDISLMKLGPKHSYVIDMKSPSSGVSEEMRLSNFEYLSMRDEIKFVVGSKEDYEWSKTIIREHHIKGTITISPVFGKIQYSELIDWILRDRLDVRFQIQLHKVIWGVDKRGV